jgi:hypothetical protein
MKFHVALQNTIRPRFRITYRIDGGTVRLSAQSAIIEHHDCRAADRIKDSLLGQWLPDGMYVGSPKGTYKTIGPDD